LDARLTKQPGQPGAGQAGAVLVAASTIVNVVRPAHVVVPWGSGPGAGCGFAVRGLAA